jgi:hypothetical protein
MRILDLDIDTVGRGVGWYKGKAGGGKQAPVVARMAGLR